MPDVIIELPLEVLEEQIAILANYRHDFGSQLSILKYVIDNPLSQQTYRHLHLILANSVKCLFDTVEVSRYGCTYLILGVNNPVLVVVVVIEEPAQAGQCYPILVLVHLNHQVLYIGAGYQLWLKSNNFRIECGEVFEADETIAIRINLLECVFEWDLFPYEPVPKLAASIFSPSLSFSLPVPK